MSGQKGGRMYVVVKVILDEHAVRELIRLKEFEDLESANDYLQEQEITETQSFTIWRE